MLELNRQYPEIRIMGDAVLRKECKTVEEFGSKTHRMARLLTDTLEHCRSGAGLAANQIGISSRAFAYDLRYRGEETHGVIFNPEIVNVSRTADFEEGCLSIPEFFWPITRPARIEVVGKDADGNEVSLKLRGIGARLFLHELDHLNGLLMFDRIEDETERRHAFAEATALIAEQDAPDSRGGSGISIN